LTEGTESTERVVGYFDKVAVERKGVYNPSDHLLTNFARRIQNVVRTLIANFLVHSSSSVILDAGSGPGRYLSLYKNLKAKVVLADFSRGMIDIAKQNCQKVGMKDRVDFVLANITKLPFNDSTFDAVVCIDVLHHIPLQVRGTLYFQLARVLRKGGVLFLEMKNARFPYYGLGASRRNPAGISIPEDPLRVTSVLARENLFQIKKIGAYPWGTGPSLVSPSVILEFKKR
jgi:ubiquinone/menaquinone biosynthesis C-methylase UbiE